MAITIIGGILWLLITILAHRSLCKIENLLIIKKPQYVPLFMLATCLSVYGLYCAGFSHLIILCVSAFLAFEFLAAMMDKEYSEVYDVIHFLAGICVLPVLITRLSTLSASYFIGLAVVLLLMSKLYGISDTMAYMVSGFMLLSLGFTILDCLLFMLLTIICFAFGQAVNKNLTAKGKIKNPMPLIPYIYLGFIVYTSSLII